MSGMDAAPAKVALEYAKPLRWHQRRRSRWVLLIVCLAVFILVCGHFILRASLAQSSIWLHSKAANGAGPLSQINAGF